MGKKHLQIFLYLVALHSFAVFLGLVCMPSSLFQQFGYHAISEPFFRIQGGVFHLVMVMAYLAAARDPIGNQAMVSFSFRAKFLATLFLINYFIFIDRIWVVLLSGLGDFIMGAAIYWLATQAGKRQPQDTRGVPGDNS